MKYFVFALCFSLATLFVACGSSKPEDIALEVNEIMHKGDEKEVSKIMSYVYISEKDKEQGAQDIFSGKLKASIADNKKKIEQKGGLKESKIIEVKENGQNRKTVKVLNIYKDDSNDSSNFSFTLRDGEWKLILR